MRKFYKPTDVADILKVSIHTINKWIQEGKLTGIKVGGVWRFTERNIKDFINKGAK